MVVILFTFLEGIVWALSGPAFQAVVPSLVPRAELDRALALNSVQFNMARLCGPMLVFLFFREPGIDNLPRRRLGRFGLSDSVWEAITAHSHHPDYPAQIAVEAHQETAPRTPMRA
jgi:hypothetical protein